MEEEIVQLNERVENVNQVKEAQCRLTSDFKGAPIDSYMSDISEDSDASEPLKGSGTTNNKNAADRRNKEESKLSKEDSAGLVQPSNVSISEFIRSSSMNDAANAKSVELLDNDSLHETQNSIFHVEGTEKQGNESLLSDECQESRKRGRKSSSECSSKSHSSSPRRARKSSSKIVNQSKDDRRNDASPSQILSQTVPSRSPPQDFSGQEAQSSGSEQSTPQILVTNTSCIFLDFTRARGDACKLLHQGSGKILQEGGRLTDGNQNLKMTTSIQNSERDSSLELEQSAGSNADAVNKEENQPRAGKMKPSPRCEVVKTLKAKEESFEEDYVLEQDLSMKGNAALSLEHESRPRAQCDPVNDLSASRVSDLGVQPPLSMPEIRRQASGNYWSPRESVMLHSHDNAQASGFSGTRPAPDSANLSSSSYMYSSIISEVNPPSDGSFGGTKHAYVHYSTGFSDNIGVLYSSHEVSRMINSSLCLGDPEHASLGNSERNCYLKDVLSYTSDYTSSFQPSAGSVESTFLPPSTHHPMSQDVDFSNSRSSSYLKNGHNSLYSLHTQERQTSCLSGLPHDSLQQSLLPDSIKHDSYGLHLDYSVLQSSQAQSYKHWSMPVSSSIVSSKSLDVQSTSGRSSSYSYTLTTVPPLPKILDISGSTKPSNLSDQYDPLSDSLEPSIMGGSNYTSFGIFKPHDNGKLWDESSQSLTFRKENESLRYDSGNCEPVEAAGDPAVGIVENVTPPGTDRFDDSGQTDEAVGTKLNQLSSKNRKENPYALKMLRSAVADHVKEELKPAWKEGHMSKDAFKNIVKKVVDKVVAALPQHSIPKSQEKVNQFMSSSRAKISKLVQGYIDKYQKS
ncbi:hypothetical protein KP509_12G018000 [Ceratopteris richardii]|uniref:SFR19-like C-terminal domain-containing protein n=2 Tax=Ceratopteris richardii TaxID=49495 RepID=A0A8T2TMK3_CERRI|nr:hypothetical protein KP509_12G018000 [Ceratopteris richardii]